MATTTPPTTAAADAADPVAAQLAMAARLQASLPETNGVDGNGKTFESLTEVWEYQLLGSSKATDGGGDDDGTHAAPSPPGTAKVEQLYSRVYRYWADSETVPATVDGMLGGMGYVSDPEVTESRQFLLAAQEARPGLTLGYALDVGAGIGRVSKHLLCPLFTSVDLVEQCPRLHAAARDFVGADNLKELYCGTMQAFEPEADKYDVIWLQWVVGYLTDVDLVATLKRYSRALRPGGMIGIKENTLKSAAFWIDQDDTYYIRSIPYFEAVFVEAGLNVASRELQKEWPAAAFPVVMFALTPAKAEGAVRK